MLTESKDGKSETEGSAPFKAKARLMLLLGEQLITNEVVAVFELVKNSYDADAKKVEVALENVSDPSRGSIVVKDNGNGMDRDTVLNSWLELGTSSKARSGSEIRKSPGDRVLLGEKGIGRLAVHKLGHKTELISRAIKSKTEMKLDIDWTEFENSKNADLDSIPVRWKERPPEVFIEKGDGSHGTQITITKLQRKWSKAQMADVFRGIDAMTSPFAGLKDFVVDFTIEDPNKPELEKNELVSKVQSAPYQYSVDINEMGSVTGEYKFYRADRLNLSRTVPVAHQVLDKKQFPLDPETKKPRAPVCGSFNLRLYVWDLYDEDLVSIFGDIATYDKLIKPNTGVRVFRDGFRVFPYGNEDDDWLGLDARRVKSFEQNVSRNMVIGIVEISSERNPDLRDKSDREGLIANQAFGDFRALVIGAIREFETLRMEDRGELKKILHRTRDRQIERIRQTLDKVSELIGNLSDSGSPEVLTQVKSLLGVAQDQIVEVIEETEQPLLVAAAIGLSYMLPTHEVRHDLQQIKNTLGRVVKEMPDSKTKSDLHQAWRLSSRADELVAGITKVLQKGKMRRLRLDSVAKSTVALLNERIEQKRVKVEVKTEPVEVIGSERLIATVFINLIDNSLYWLDFNEATERRINVVVGNLKDGSPYFLVSDNGPGLTNDLSALIRPFVSHKAEGGMGLGLYIANQVAQNHGARLRTFAPGEVSGVLGGATVGMVFPKAPPKVDDSK